jgi:integrase
VLDIPEDLRPYFGKKRHVKSLRTQSQTEAERLVLGRVAQWKAEFEALRTGSSLPLEVLAKSWRRDYENATGDALDTLQEVLDEKALEIARSDPTKASEFYATVTGERILLQDHVEAWIGSLQDTPKTRDMKRTDVRRFVAAFPASTAVTREAVQRWVYSLQTEQNLQAATTARIISACRGFWLHLQRAGLVRATIEPFANLKLERKKSRKRKADEDQRRVPFTQQEVLILLEEAKRKDDAQLASLIELAMWTGCRIEELCSLRIEHVSETSIQVTDAKTKAGRRKVPIHTRLGPSLARLAASSTDGYIISGLTSNKYGDRSNAVGKRFSTMKKRLGFGRTKVFHSIRKTVATLLENAGLPENVSADILGHEKHTMTYGLYSGGASLAVMQEAINRISYD